VGTKGEGEKDSAWRPKKGAVSFGKSGEQSEARDELVQGGRGGSLRRGREGEERQVVMA